MFTVDRLVLDQRLRNLVECRTVFADDVRRPLVLLVDDPVNLLIDLPRRLLGDVFIARDLTAKEHRVVMIAEGDRTKRAHAPVTHHVTRDLRDLFDVARRTAGDVTEDE